MITTGHWRLADRSYRVYAGTVGSLRVVTSLHAARSAMPSIAAPSAPPLVSSVNYHLWQACNMRCRFCFATFQEVRKSILPAGHLDMSEALAIVDRLAEAGFKKINFAGGEPFLCPWLDLLVMRAKERGMVTSVVTNGSYFDRPIVRDLLPYLDWFVLSVDSVLPETLRQLGRVAAHEPISRERYLDICRQVRATGVQLKINTVVTSVNYDEKLAGFIRKARPARWKVMQVLPVDGPDSRVAEDLLITAGQFNTFVRRNRRIGRSGVKIVPETNEEMLGSYVMIDPAGRFYDNVGGKYHYSSPILTAGVAEALGEVSVSRDLFLARGGQYDFVEPLATTTRSVQWPAWLKAMLRSVPSVGKTPEAALAEASELP